MGMPGSTEMIIVLIIVLIIFGPKNLPRLAQSFGRSVRELKKGLQGMGDDVKGSMDEDLKSHTDQASASAAKSEDAAVDPGEAVKSKNV